MLRTRSGLPKYCSWNEDQHGTRRVRFRKHGLSTYLTGTPWSEDFKRQYAAALEGLKAATTEIGASRKIDGSFSALCVHYYRSPDFKGLRPSTRANRRNILDRFRSEHGHRSAKGLNRATHLKVLIGAKAATPHAANNLLKLLRIVLNYGVSIETNPAIGIKPYRASGDGFHSWSEAEIARFEARHPICSRARLAMALMLYTASAGVTW